MDETKLLKLFFIFGFPIFIFILFLIIITSVSSSGNDSVMVTNLFRIPFEDNTYYTITSNFGYRINPLDKSEEQYHSGVDLAAVKGTHVLATADGIVYETGYSKSLGNYVYIQHNTELGIIYSAYGHMLDNSICVEKEQPVVTGQKIGEVGTTGASTGYHLHFTLMKNKISFEKKDLIDPSFIITGLK